MTNTEQFGVSLGDGSRRFTQGRCGGLSAEGGKTTLEVDAFVLELGGIDLILGLECFETLGETVVD